jgi:hypothetical protein
VGGKWQVDTPPDLYKWMCLNDGGDAIVTDDATQTHYFATEAAAQRYRDKWAKESRRDDQRTAAMFYDLGRRLWEEEGQK